MVLNEKSYTNVVRGAWMSCKILKTTLIFTFYKYILKTTYCHTVEFIDYHEKFLNTWCSPMVEKDGDFPETKLLIIISVVHKEFYYT